MISEFKPGKVSQNTDAPEMYSEGKWHHTQSQWQIILDPGTPSLSNKQCTKCQAESGTRGAQFWNSHNWWTQAGEKLPIVRVSTEHFKARPETTDEAENKRNKYNKEIHTKN